MQQIIVIEPIVTDRLILKALVKEDASAILHILSDRETAWWSDDFKMRSLDEAIDFIDWGNEAIDVIHYGLFRKESEKAIGYIQIKLPKCSGIKDEPIEKKHKRFLDDQPVDLYVRRRPDTDMSLDA